MAQDVANNVGCDGRMFQHRIGRVGKHPNVWHIELVTTAAHKWVGVGVVGVGGLGWSEWAGWGR